MQLGELSDYFTWGAITAYTIAMVCFAIDLSKVSEALGAKRMASVGGSTSEQDSEPVSYVGRRTRPLSIAMATTVLGAALHLTAIITRGVAAGRVPWANMYEFCLTGTFVAIAVFLAVQIRKEIRYIGVIVTLLAVLFLVVGMNSFHIIAWLSCTSCMVRATQVASSPSSSAW